MKEPVMNDNHHTLFHVISNDERVIVFSSFEDGCLITWNRSLTLQWWVERTGGTWEEVDIRTLSYEPANYEEAREKAEEWYNAVAFNR
jgi:hypothetical protein